jgi:hypothetical protein
MTEKSDEHFPRTHREFIEAALRLRNESGLTPSDIAPILTITASGVTSLLREADTGLVSLASNSYVRPERQER